MLRVGLVGAKKNSRVRHASFLPEKFNRVSKSLSQNYYRHNLLLCKM